MSARKPRTRGIQSGTVPGDCALLKRCGLVDAAGRVLGAEGPHPDARLLVMVAEYTTLMEAARALYHQLGRYKEDGRAYKRLWREILSTRDCEEELEQEIVATKAVTSMGLLAKMGLYVDMHGDNTGSWLGRPISVMREAMAMLGDDLVVHAPRQPA